MTKKEYRCLKCGWYIKTDEHELKCPICGSTDIIVEIDEEVDDIISNYLNEQNPQQMVEIKTKNMAMKEILKGFEKWGIERTEDKIKEINENYPEMRDYMLKIYRGIITRRIK